MFLTNRRTVSTGIETTVGTPVALTDGSNVRLSDLSIAANVETAEVKNLVGDFGETEVITGTTGGTVSFKHNLYVESTVAESNWFKFPRTCGCKVVAASDTTWSGYCIYPSMDMLNSGLTVGVYDSGTETANSGIAYTFTGAMGNLKVASDGTGKPLGLTYEYQGSLYSVADIAATGVPVFSGSTPSYDKFLNGSFTINVYQGCISSFEFDAGNTISPVQCNSATTGISQYIVTDMQPSLTVNPLLDSIADYDFWSKWKDGTVETVILNTQKMMLVIPRAQISSSSVEDSDGLLRNSLQFKPLRPLSSGNFGYAPWYIALKCVTF